MIDIPDNFPSYTAYNAKQLLQQVDTLKAAIKELQDHINALNLHIRDLKELTADLDLRVEVLEAGKKKAQ
jgi:prefoldin subunit 5